MDRRSFIRRGAKRAGHAVLREAERQAESAAVRWIRPPFAARELDVLLNCTRCGDCITACEHHVVFPLSARLGAKVAGTPALDVLNRGCHLCVDWPCVTACTTGALRRPDPTSTQLPTMALAVIDTSACIAHLGPECGACESS